MLEVQLEHFSKTPLLTNTQPDYSRVGNSELVDRTDRSNNWIRSDTIFVENEQIEALSNRPPWIAALLEQGLPGKPPDPRVAYEGISLAENMIAHVIDVGANYWSLWSFHQISAKNLMSYYQAYPAAFDRISRRIGYRVRPSFIWSSRKSAISLYSELPLPRGARVATRSTLHFRHPQTQFVERPGGNLLL